MRNLLSIFNIGHMLIDPKTGQKILPNTDHGASHYHLMIDPQGTGLHHANLQPDDFGEHEHQAHQITVLFGEVCLMSAWHSDTGHRLQSQVRVNTLAVVCKQLRRLENT